MHARPTVRSLRRCIMCVVAAACLSSSAAAQRSPGDAEFFEGMSALEAGLFAEARDHFRASLEVEPRPAPAFNLAFALRGLGDVLGAEEVYRALRRGEYGELSARGLDDVESFLEEVARSVGIVRVRVLGAPRIAVRLDGQMIGELDDGSLVERRCNPGARRLTFSAAEHVTAEREVQVGAGETVDEVVRLLPEPDGRPGRLELTVDDEDAQVSIVGVAEGHSPLARDLPAGRYAVRVRNRDGVRDQEILLPAGRRVQIELSLPDAPLRRRPTFWLVLGGVIAVGAAAAATGVLLRRRVADPVQVEPWGNIVIGE